MTKFRRALKQTIEYHGELLEMAIRGIPGPMWTAHTNTDCGFCEQYSCDCSVCPVTKLCAQYTKNKGSDIESELFILTYLHWLWDNNISEREMKEADDEMA